MKQTNRNLHEDAIKQILMMGKRQKWVKGKDGKTGTRGTDGVGIKAIKAEGPNLLIKLTNGDTKEVFMPVRGGRGAAIAPPAVQSASRTPFDSSKNNLTSKTVQDAVVELNTLVGQAASGNPFVQGTAAKFMFDFNTIDSTHSSKFVYNGSKQLISTSVINESAEVLYLIYFTYDGKKLESKLISDIIAGDSVDTTFSYDVNNLLVDKALVYSA